MGDPPSEAGGAQLTTTDPSPPVAVTPVTGPGAVGGGSGDAGADGGEVRPALAAVTVVAEPVPGDPPSEAGAVQLTPAEALPAVAVTPVGTSGTVMGVTADDGEDAGLVPTALVAVTVKV